MTSAQEPPPAQAQLPEGNGLSAKYPGDKGIEADPAVVFVEQFDEPSVEEMVKNWNEAKNKPGMAFTDDVPAESAGGTSLKMTAVRGKDEGAHLFKVFKPGYEQLYARFYVKFAKDNGYLHHFIKLQGSINPPNYPEGGAGGRPTDSWTTGIEPTRSDKNKYPATDYGPPGIWHFYSYWPEMRSWETPDGKPNNPPNGTGTSFYGNFFAPVKPCVVPRDEWVCVEFMVKMNDVDKPNGGQAFWINGKLAGNFMPGAVRGYWMRDTFRNDPTDQRSRPFEGIRWRTKPEVLVNKLWFLYYMSEDAFKNTEQNAAGTANAQQNSVWFDHVVVAKQYIGPLAK
jgi:hypothetical protein